MAVRRPALLCSEGRSRKVRHSIRQDSDIRQRSGGGGGGGGDNGTFPSLLKQTVLSLFLPLSPTTGKSDVVVQATKAVAVALVGLDGEGRERGDCGRKGTQSR